MLFSKPTRKPKWAFLISLTATILLSCAQAQANGKVYQVELIIFDRGAQRSGQDAEGWQKNVVLEYPQNWLQLIDPDEEVARQEEVNQENSLRLSDDFLQTLAEERDAYVPADAPATAAEQPSAGTKFFEYLPQESLNLRKTRDALIRRNHYRILFHETWLQPMTLPENSKALILHGGKRYGDHYELQGYINLGVSRFLHIQTDLWLSEFSVNQGQDVGPTPHIPLEPRLATDQTTAFANKESGEDNFTNESFSHWERPSTERWQQEIDESPYLVKQINTLRQKRRMRSGELHYLDHPRFGVLIKITPQ